MADLLPVGNKGCAAGDKIRAEDKYTDDGFIVANEFGHYLSRNLQGFNDRLLKDAMTSHFTFHALRHTPLPPVRWNARATRPPSVSLSFFGHYSVAFWWTPTFMAWTNTSGAGWTRWTICSGCSTVSLRRTSLILCFVHSRQIPSPTFLTSPKLPHKRRNTTPPCSKSNSKSKKPYASHKNPPIPTKQEQIVVHRTACWYSSRRADRTDRSYFYLPTRKIYPQKRPNGWKSQAVRRSRFIVFGSFEVEITSLYHFP